MLRQLAENKTPTRSVSEGCTRPSLTLRVSVAGRFFLASCLNRRGITIGILSVALWFLMDQQARAQGGLAPPDVQLDIKELIKAGGAIGIVIAALSIAMLALIFEHFFSIRRNALMPRGLAEAVHQHIAQRKFKDAEQQCKLQPSFLGYVMLAGLSDVDIGYSAVEKSMEDTSTEQAARLFRKIEYLHVIATLAPMLGLLGTVWGMILAFMEFESKANPQVAELAPGIYKALVTTLMGLGVAVPALASFAIFRNRIDELVAEASLTAEHVFADFKRSQSARKKAARERRRKKTQPTQSEQGTPTVANENPTG